MIKNKYPQISVIIPTYNRATIIDRCVQSIINQTIEINEIIVIDDCSTDNTVEVIGSFKDIKLLTTSKNSGAQAARNIGIKAAKSEWIAFCDSDDEWISDKLEKQFLALESVNFNPLTVIHGDCIVKNIESGKDKIWNLEKTEGDNIYQQLLSKSGTFFPAILTSKYALEKIGFLDEDISAYQEWDTSIRLAKICRFKHIQEPLFIYNIQNDSISISSEQNLSGYHFIIRKYESEIKNICGTDVFDNHLIICANMAMNVSNFNYSRVLLNELSKTNFKKITLLILSFLRIRPKYIYHTMKYLPWKN